LPKRRPPCYTFRVFGSSEIDPADPRILRKFANKEPPMYYVYWQKNIKSLIKLQSDGIKDFDEAQKQAAKIADKRRSGSIILLKIWGYVPDEMWTMSIMKNYRTISHKNARAYLPDYEQVIHNGKRRWVKTNPKQERLFE
jgi:hypothetical protein